MAKAKGKRPDMWRPADDVICNLRGDLYVLIRLNDPDEEFRLEKSAAAIWFEILKGCSLADIFAALKNTYGPLESRDKTWVREFIKQLETAELIVPA